MDSRIYTYRKGLFFDYRRRSNTWRNEHLGNKLWHIKEYWFVNFRFNKKWFAKDDWYYDGHTGASVTICGLEIGWGYSYDSRALIDWVNKGEL